MKRSIVNPATLPIVILALACSGDGTGPDDSTPEPTLELSTSSLAFEALGDTARVSAALTSADGDTISTAVTWSTADAEVADVDATGLVTSVAVGSTRISARIDDQEAELTVTVAQAAASVVVTPAADTLDAIGDTVVFAAVARDRNDNEIPDVQVTWSSADADIVGVDQSGRATSKAVGTVEVQARAGDAIGASLVVSRQVPVALRVQPDSAGLVPGDSLTLTAAIVDANDVPIDSPDGIEWETSDGGVVTAGATGVIHAIATGTARISASLDAMTDTIIVDVAWLELATLDVGGQHSCGLTASGALYCWGDNTNGQLGDGTREHRSSPVRHLAGRYADVSTGNWHNCAIARDGKTYCFGANSDGQSTGESGDVIEPRSVSEEIAFAAVYTGGLHSCGLTAAGQAHCWGENQYGGLGTGTASPIERSPTPVAGGLSFSSLALGGLFSCGLATDGAAYCWGYSALGRLGIGSHPEESYLEPEPVAGGLTFVQLAAGGSSACGLRASGALYCWGSDNFGQIGDGAASTPCFIGEFEHECVDVPTAVSGGLLFESVTVGSNFACGIADSGAAYCWGTNGSGQLGIGSDGGTYDEPQPVAGGHTFTALQAGIHHVCGLASDGLTYCWGLNNHGQVGDATMDTTRNTPTPVARQTP